MLLLTTPLCFKKMNGILTCIYLVQQPAHVDRAVEHICFLADVNRLYDHALGLYDLDLTLLVAQQSQKVSKCHALLLSKTNRAIGSSRISPISPKFPWNVATSSSIFHRQPPESV